MFGAVHVLSVLSSFAIILLRKIEVVASLLLSSCSLMTASVLCLPHGAAGWSVVFPDHVRLFIKCLPILS